MTVERLKIDLVEQVDDSEFNQACAHGSLVDGHAVYCHNSEWAEAPRKCRRTWYTGGETRDEDCKGFKARVIAIEQASYTDVNFTEQEQ